MAFLWGGSKSLSELASKFGWLSVIASLILYPVLLLWVHLIAYPFWLMALVPHGSMYFRKSVMSYPDKGDGKDNQWRERLYCSSTSPAKCSPAGWNVYADVEGGKFFESFFGLIQVLDMKANDEKFIMSANFLSWFPVKVLIEYPNAPVYEHSVRFYFPLDGPNKYNPFAWLTIAFIFAAIFWSSTYSYTELKSSLSMTSVATMFPPAEDPDKLNPDKSFKEFPSSSKASEYGAV